MERKLFECKRCGHKWLSSKEHPILCAKCHSAYWDTPKSNKVVVPQKEGEHNG
jgi:Zn finger protein HypA/HybF involved in hydrogenase expression